MIKNPRVTEYYANAPEKFREMLTNIRKTIFDIAANEPEMSEVFSYQIAVYKYGKKPLFSIAYFKNHCSLISQDKNIATKIPRLKSYKISGTSIHFTNDYPLNENLAQEIITQRLKDRKEDLKD